jgi:hypothetical protein
VISKEYSEKRKAKWSELKIDFERLVEDVKMQQKN